MARIQKRRCSGIYCLSVALGLFLCAAGCRSQQSAGTPPPTSERLNRIMNDPHIPASIKEAARQQALGQQAAGVSGRNAPK